jgi:hypothetical protein
MKHTYRISHSLWCDTIFIQLVVCCLSPSLGKGIENTQGAAEKSHHYIKHGRFFLSHMYHQQLFLLTLFFEGYGVGIHNIYYQKIITSDITLILRKYVRVCFVIWYDFYPTICVISIPEPLRGDRNHMSWIKIILHHKTWNILFITHLPPTYLFCILYSLDFVA